MATPTIQTSNLKISYVNSNGFRLTYSVGNGARRLVAVTEGSISDVRYPVDGVNYDASLKFENGDQLISTVGGTGTCYPYPYPDPIEATMSSTMSTTYVVYEGMNDGVNGLDIIGLKPQTEYQVMSFEHNNYCYATSSILSIYTGLAPNTKKMEFTVYDNRTRNPIGSASISIKERSGFISDFGETSDDGSYTSLDLEEGRYEVSILSPGYESKILTGLFIQRSEPKRDNYYRIFTSAGNTEIGSTSERRRLMNKNQYTVYLDPINTTNRSFSRYQPSPNPSRLTKI